MTTTKRKSAVILLSGGLDSATCLSMAQEQNYQVIALSFFYEQRHNIELHYAKKLCEIAKVKEHVNLSIDFSKIGASALTSNISVPKDALETGGNPANKNKEKNADKNKEENENIPVTYVPARNLVFLSLAASLAEARQCSDIFIGVNALDYSGYPDCRPEFINAFSACVNLGTKQGVMGETLNIHTPLIKMTKKEIIQQGFRLKTPYQYTWSCYDPQKNKSETPETNQDDSNYLTAYQPCGHCDSCLLRAKGFLEAGHSDPLTQSKRLSK